MSDVYLIILEGGGDTFVKVVDKETFDWVNSEDPGHPHPLPGSWVDTLVPKIQIDLMTKDQGTDYEPLTITRGSWDNDRAMAAMNTGKYDRMDFCSVREAKRAVRSNGDKVAGQYEGGFY